MVRRQLLWAGVPVLAAALVVGALIHHARIVKPAKLDTFAATQEAYQKPPEQAQVELESIVKAAEAKSGKEAVETAHVARMRLGYVHAKQGDYKAARKVLLTSAKAVAAAGSEEAVTSLSDQAVYQAAICLLGDGDQAGAKRELFAFLQQRPESSLAHAAHRRLVRLTDGAERAKADRLMQRSVVVRAEKARLEAVSCGPKLVKLLVAIRTRREVAEEEAARRCGMTERGTSFDGIRRAFRSYGIESYGLMLNREDLLALPAPFILSGENHFVAVLERNGDVAVIHDPASGRSTQVNFARQLAADALNPVLTFEVPTLNRRRS